MTETTPGHPARIPGMVAGARRLVGAFTRRGYPEDEQRRKRVKGAAKGAGLVGIVAALVTVIQTLVSDASQARKDLVATQRQLIEIREKRADEQRADFKEAIAAMQANALAMEHNAAETKALGAQVESLARGLLARTAAVRPREVSFKPAPAGLERPKPQGGVKPP